MLLGSEEDINALAQKDHATILAVSDSHGAYANLFLYCRNMPNKTGMNVTHLFFVETEFLT